MIRRLITDKKNWKKLLFVYHNNKNNKFFESSYDSQDRKVRVVGFYHAYCMCDGWKELVEEQICHLRKSGLYDRIEKFYCGAIIEETDIQELQRIGGEKLSLLYVSQDRSLFEFQTLNYLYEKCNEEKPFIGFYFHTKGISWLNQDKKIYNVGNSWRQMNEFFMFDKYKIAIHALCSGSYDLYGANYQELFNDKFRILGGNFFWFRSDYVKTLDYLGIHRENRNMSETWIASKTHNVYSPFDFSGNTRYDTIPSCFYKECSRYRRFFMATKIYFSRFGYFFRRISGCKLNLVNRDGIVK